VVPVHGAEPFVAQCLDSILSTPGDAIEVVAVDDASPDDSGAILDRRAELDPRLHVVHLPHNHGLGGARNAGLDRVRGAYVWFVDADDWLPGGTIPAVLQRLALHRPDVLVVDHAERFPDGRVELRKTAALVPGLSAPLRLADHPQLMRIAHSACTKVTRREFLHQLGLRFHDGLYEDSVFSHHLLMAAGRIDVLDRNCYMYRLQSGGSITTSMGQRHFEVFDQYTRLFEIVERAGGAYDAFRPELFRAMINHYLVILGNPHRLRPEMRREFFRRIVRDYRRFLPRNGYPRLSGVAGLKHRLVRHNAYAAYASLRMAYRATSYPS
jgi:CDP-glycerol glycerophosphotransferase